MYGLSSPEVLRPSKTNWGCLVCVTSVKYFTWLVCYGVLVRVRVSVMTAIVLVRIGRTSSSPVHHRSEKQKEKMRGIVYQQGMIEAHLHITEYRG